MKFLVTGGGTEVDIDDVRSIKNFSKGTTSSLIVKYLLEDNHQVDYIISKEGKTPFKYEIDINKNPDYKYIDSNLKNFLDWSQQYIDYYNEWQYRTYYDYCEITLSRIRDQEYHAVILAAAVSDFGVTKEYGKISKELELDFFNLPKVISTIKSTQDTFLVGFKLSSSASDIDLVQSAFESIKHNKCDMVVANSLKEVGKNVICVHNTCKVEKSQGDISKFIVDQILERLK